LLELDASYEPARLRLGYLHLDAGDPVSARSVFELVLRKTPSEPAALQGLAQCDLDEGEPQSALERLAPASLREGAQRPLTQRLRGLALARLGRNAEAEIALAEGLAAKPVIQDPWSREVNRFKVGLSALIMRAQKLVDRGKVPAALELIEVHRDAGDTRVLRLLGKAYARQGRFADAAGALADAFVLEPDAPELALALAAAYSQDLRTGEASSVLIGFLERSPQHIGPWRGYQELAFKTAAVELVLEIRDKAFRAGHRDVELETVAGHAAMALERFDVAEERYSAAVDAGPATAEIHLGRARARIELEDFRGAGDDLVVAAGMGHPDVEEVRMLYDKRRQGRRD
ncbi:MAG: tetratricopeptide repeat protein, partial [Planctomycetota bacterium]|nr:tetratricopeptide repeat protein [Planctomycetota bacterium]